MTEHCFADLPASLPKQEAGEEVFRFFPEDSSYLVLYQNCSSEDYITYLRRLEQNGYIAGEDYALGENRYVLRYGEDLTVYLSYNASPRTLRLYVEKKDFASYPSIGKTEEGSDAPVLWQLPVDVKGSRQNGGMTYVLRTPTGSFVIIDGGYGTETEADTIYRCLKENTPEGRQTVIEGWWFTHLHWDHFGGMINFSEKYAGEIPVKAFYLHTDYRWVDEGSQKRFRQAMSAGLWANAAHYTKLHTGMKVMQGGLPFSVLYTLEDLYPLKAGENYDFNSTSTVFSIALGGQRLMILGDVMREACDCIMRDIPHSLLKSDLVQYSHHGYEGGTRELYDTIAAPVVLWPMNVAGYQENYPEVPQNVFGMWHKMSKCGKNYPLQNQYICYEADYVKQILLPREDRKIVFPYTPSGARLPAFDAIYRCEIAGYHPDDDT